MQRRLVITAVHAKSKNMLTLCILLQSVKKCTHCGPVAVLRKEMAFDEPIPRSALAIGTEEAPVKFIQTKIATALFLLAV